MCLSVNFFWFKLYVICSVSWICMFMYFTKFMMFQPLFLQVPFQHALVFFSSSMKGFGPLFYSGFLEWCIYCLKIFYLARLLFHGLSVQESRLLAGLSLSGPVGISRFLGSLEPILRYITQKWNPRNSSLYCSLALNSLNDVASSLHLLVFLCLFYI